MELSGENFRRYYPTVPSDASSRNPSPKHIRGPYLPIAVTVTTDAGRTNAGLTAVSRIGLSLVLRGRSPHEPRYVFRPPFELVPYGQ